MHVQTSKTRFSEALSNAASEIDNRYLRCSSSYAQWSMMSRRKRPIDIKNVKHPAQAQKLISLRGNKTQAAFASELGLPLRTYQRYETGERKMPIGLLKLANLLCGQVKVEKGDPYNKARSGNKGLSEATGTSVDSILLRQVIERVERNLAKDNLAMAPAKKAELISLLYDYFTSAPEQPKEGTVERFMKLIA